MGLGLGFGFKDGCGGADIRTCSYPSLFARWLARTYYGRLANDSGGAGSNGIVDGFFYENRAMGGTTTAGELPMLPLDVVDHRSAAGESTGVDLIIVDFSVSNCLLNPSFFQCVS